MVGRETIFWGLVHWSLGQEGWLSLWFFFSTQTLGELKFVTCFFGQKCDKESERQVGGQKLLHIQLQYFFSHKLPKTVITLLLFVHVTMLCAFLLHFSLFSWVKDLCSYQTVRPTRPRHAPAAYPFILVQFANTDPLILLSEAYQCRSKISPLSASDPEISSDTCLQHYCSDQVLLCHLPTVNPHQLRFKPATVQYWQQLASEDRGVPMVITQSLTSVVKGMC